MSLVTPITLALTPASASLSLYSRCGSLVIRQSSSVSSCTYGCGSAIGTGLHTLALPAALGMSLVAMHRLIGA